ncbi:MAG: cupredoxin domain-containing protein [Actinomycetota bacterium]
MRTKVMAVGMTLVLGAAAPSTSFAGQPSSDEHVSAYNHGFYDAFDPTTVVLARGGTVTFHFDGPDHHTATDGTGMDLYDSGVVDEGGPSFSYTYQAAGGYRFVCTLHSEMSGQVRVPLTVWPPKGPRRERFTVRWAAAVAESGFVYDVQIRRPGEGWRRWVWATGTRSTTFLQDGGRGRYRFRARMRQLGTGGSSGWSNPDRIEVT